jgi:hypothetical protein
MLTECEICRKNKQILETLEGLHLVILHKEFLFLLLTLYVVL